jgi:hypothetical protein
MMSAMMMERTGMGVPGMGMQGTGMPGMSMPSNMPAGTGMMMVPRCTVKMERVSGGLKMTCSTDDQLAASMMQSLCNMLQGGLCSCCMMMNGMTVCCCNLAMGMCKCDMTKNGVVISCTSGDPKCAEMIQACCDCMATMCKSGCTCCVMMNNTPVCCGGC